jgi:hypothetical protein
MRKKYLSIISNHFKLCRNRSQLLSILEIYSYRLFRRDQWLNERIDRIIHQKQEHHLKDTIFQILTNILSKIDTLLSTDSWGRATIISIFL